MASLGAGNTVKALWDFNPAENNELAFKAGDLIRVLTKTNKDWWEGEVMGTGKQGFFPANRVEELDKSLDVSSGSSPMSKSPSRPSLAPKPSLSDLNLNLMTMNPPSAQGNFPGPRTSRSPTTSSTDGRSSRPSIASSGVDGSPAVANLEMRAARSSAAPLPTQLSAELEAVFRKGSKPTPVHADGKLHFIAISCRHPESVALCKCSNADKPSSAIIAPAASIGMSPAAKMAAAMRDQRTSTPPSPRLQVSPTSPLDSAMDDDTAEGDDQAEWIEGLDPPVSADIRKEGLLNRKNEGSSVKSMRSWKQIWAELANGMLYIYKDAPNKKKLDKRDRPLGGIEVKGGVIVDNPKTTDKKKNVFQLITSRGQIYLFQAQNESEGQSWLESIMAETRFSGALPKAPVINEAKNASTKDSPAMKGKKEDEKKGLFGKKADKIKARSSKDDDPYLTEDERRAQVKTKLFSFFKSRPSMGALVEKGIIREDLTFGGLLELTIYREKSKVPMVVEQCVKQVESKGMDTVGIYRLSGNASTIQKLRFLYNQGDHLVDLTEEAWSDVNVVTGVLKLFFRELENPLLTFERYSQFVDVAKITDLGKRTVQLRDLVKALPAPYYSTLEFLIRHLVRVSKFRDVNKMDAGNLAIVFGPTLLRPAVESMDTILNMNFQNSVVETLIVQADTVFK